MVETNRETGASIASFERCHSEADFQAEQLKAWPMIWRLKVKLAERFGHSCRVNARGAMNSIEVEFPDGFRVITSRFAVRKGRTA